MIKISSLSRSAAERGLPVADLSADATFRKRASGYAGSALAIVGAIVFCGCDGLVEESEVGRAK